MSPAPPLSAPWTNTYTFRIKATDNVSNTTTDWQVSQPVAVYGVTKYYTHGSNRVAMRRGDALYYLNGDHLGSTSLTTDDTGNIVSEVRYLPYGEERWTSGATPTDFTFTGQRNEAGFGLMDYNARYYNPRLGRFISPDTIVPDPLDSQMFNRYAYVNSNPVKYVDPSGHSGGLNDFLLGVVYEVTSNNYDGLMIPSSSPLRADAEALATSQTDNVAFQGGRIVGGLASAVQGAAEIIGGAGTAVGGATGGIVTSPTVAGAVAGGAVAAAGVGVAAHGAGTFFNGVVGASEAGQNIYNAMAGRGRGSGLSNQTREQLLESKTSYEALIQEHQQKLTDYIRDPYAYDNKDLLKNAPTEEIRQKIINGRIDVIQKQIDKQMKELDKINKLLEGG